MATEAQILANRRNAQKSTGPRTPAMSLGPATAKHFAKTSTPGECFMQNKANFRKAQMNVSFYSQKDYENESAFTLGQNKANFCISSSAHRL